MRKADVGISCHRDGIFGDLYFSTKIVEYLTRLDFPCCRPGPAQSRKDLPEDCLFYFEPGNEASLAEAIRLVWHNPAEVFKHLTESRKISGTPFLASGEGQVSWFLCGAVRRRSGHT